MVEHLPSVHSCVEFIYSSLYKLPQITFMIVCGINWWFMLTSPENESDFKFFYYVPIVSLSKFYLVE